MKFTTRLFALLLALTVPATATMVTTHADAKSKGKKLFKKIKKGVKKAAKDVAKELEDSDEIKEAVETGKKNYAKTAKEGEAAYKKTTEEVKKGIDAAKKAALQAAANEYLKKYKGFLGKFQNNIEKLAENDSAMDAVERLIESASEKDLDDEARKDLLLVGEALGMLDWKPNSIVPGNSGGALKSAWGISIGGSAGSLLGANAAFGLVANCYKEAGEKYRAGLFVSVGGAVGAIMGGSVSITFFWQPDGVPNQVEGGMVGLGIDGAAGGLGGALGIQWGVQEGMKGASAGIPGFYLGWSGGAKYQAGGLQGGYTWVPVVSKK